MKSLVLLACASTLLVNLSFGQEDKQTLVKIGYEAADTEGVTYNGIGGSLEKPTTHTGNGFGTFFVSAYRLEIDDYPFSSLVYADSNVDIFTAGFKYNFSTHETIENESNSQAFFKALESGMPYIKIGFARTNGDFFASGPAGTSRASDSDTGLMYGFGFETIKSNVGFFVGWTKYTDDLVDDDTLKLGALISF